MPLAPAQKAVSDNPPSNSVVSPVDKEAKDADVQRKMRMYGVIEALRNNRYPDNEQADAMFKHVLEHSPVEVDKLSPEGKKLVEDIRMLIETSRKMVREKNADELFQSFLYSTTQADYSQARPEGTAPVSKDEAKQHGREAAHHCRTLAKLILTNSEARKLLTDSKIIGRDIFADAAQTAADRARPSEEQRRGVDEPAPSDQWVGSKGQTHGPEETPDTSRYEHQAREQAQTAGQAKEAARIHAQDVAGSADEARKGAGDDPNAGMDVGKSKLREKLNLGKDKVPAEHKERAKAQYGKAKDYLSDTFPQERRDQFYYRMKKVIVECQKHKDYQDAIEFFLTQAENYKGHGSHIARQGRDAAGNVVDDNSFGNALTNLRVLLERFANGKSTQPIFDAIDQLYSDAQQDEELRNWFKRFDHWTRQNLQEPGYIMSDESTQEGNRIREDSRRFFDHKYKGHKDNLFNAIGDFGQGFAEDPLNVRFGEDWKRLTKDLLLDSDGNLTFKPQLWSDIRAVIVPNLVDKAGYIPVPRIEYASKEADLVIENLVLELRNLLPSIIELEAHQHFKFSPYGDIPGRNHHRFTLTFSQVQADMRDVAFYCHKKTGFPKIKDSGLADVVIGGKGLSGVIYFENSEDDPHHVIVLKKVKVKIHSFKFSIRDSKHNALYAVMRGLAGGLIKKQICKAIQDGIETGFNRLDEQLVEIREQMVAAKENEGQSRRDVLKTMFERKSTSDASSMRSSGVFKLTTTKEGRLFPEYARDDLYTEQQAERQALARQGEGWHSNAFSIAV